MVSEDHSASYTSTGGSFLELRRPKCEGNNTSPSKAEVKITRSSTSTPPYVFMAWYLDKHSGNFTFTFFLSSVLYSNTMFQIFYSKMLLLMKLHFLYHVILTYCNFLSHTASKLIYIYIVLHTCVCVCVCVCVCYLTPYIPAMGIYIGTFTMK